MSTEPAASPDEPPTALIGDADALAALIARLRPVPAIAFDLEFLSQDRLAPTLCLVQLGWREADRVEVRLVDPLAVDVRPLIELLGDGRVVIAHGARQDVGLIAAQFDRRVAGLFDTQIAAAFVGIGEQVGYGRLAAMLVGAQIDKDSQWTDWDRRPLSPRQLRYAIADVAHLPAIHDLLVDKLGPRRPWVVAEGAAMVEEAWEATRVTGAEAWRAVGGARNLDRAGLAALIELAAWRHDTAVAENLPLGHVAPDRTLVELARARPPDERALRKVRGAHELRGRNAGIFAAVTAGAARAERGDLPDLGGGGGPSSARAQLWIELVLALVADAAERTGIAARFLATRSDAEALCRAVDRAGSIDGLDHPLFTTWRREVIGDTIARWFGGNAALAVDLTGPTGISLR